MPARAEGGGAARQQAGAHLPPGKADQGPPAPGSRRQIHRPGRLPGRAERLHPQSRRSRSSAARRHRDRPWQPMPSVSSTARCPGPSSDRDTSSYAWENTTPLSVTMPHAGGSLRRPDRRAPSERILMGGPRAGTHSGASTDARRSFDRSGSYRHHAISAFAQCRQGNAHDHFTRTHSLVNAPQARRVLNMPERVALDAGIQLGYGPADHTDR